MTKWAIVLALLSLTSISASADDWTVTRLRGTVLELAGGKWESLGRGDTVSDDRLVRSLNGRATLVRGQEKIELSADTIIQINDRAGQQYTVVVNHQGTVGIEAEVRNVEHFSVVTPHLAAVVKGTIFSVSTSKSGSTLNVARGEVLMRDTAFDQTMSVAAGQSVSTGSDPAQVVRSTAPAAVVSPPPAQAVYESLTSSPSDQASSSASAAPLPPPVAIVPPGVPASLPPVIDHNPGPLLPVVTVPPNVEPIAPPPVIPPVVTPPIVEPPVVLPPVINPPDEDGDEDDDDEGEDEDDGNDGDD